MHQLLEPYRILVDFLGKALGSDYEITLHDLSDKRNAMVAIANGHISGRSLGAPLTSLAMRFLADREYEQADYKVGYRGISQNRAQLRSSTMFIKDDSGQLIGMLCINFDPSRCVQAANAILTSCGLDPISNEVAPAFSKPAADVSESTENFMQSMPDVIRCTIEDVSGKTNVPVDRLTMDEKIQIVDSLYRSGVFFLKGAVSEVARQLGSSEATIYRYLSKLKK